MLVLPLAHFWFPDPVLVTLAIVERCVTNGKRFATQRSENKNGETAYAFLWLWRVDGKTVWGRGPMTRNQGPWANEHN